MNAVWAVTLLALTPTAGMVLAWSATAVIKVYDAVVPERELGGSDLRG